jgi:N-formylglutamate amidohydrolase
MNAPCMTSHLDVSQRSGIFTAMMLAHATPDLEDAAPEPARVVLPAKGVAVRPVVFSSPHSGEHYPPALLARSRLPLQVLRRMEDAFVDRLVAAGPEHGAQLVCAVYARTWVDLNREASELDLTMFADPPRGRVSCPGDRVRAGFGCLPRMAAAGLEIYDAPLSWRDAEDRLNSVHAGFHRALAARVEAARVLGEGRAILIDWHSMPSAARAGRALPHIVLGDRYGAACSHKLIGAAEKAFRRLGYTVARNAPYAGGYTTRHWGRPDQGVHALQIEINRALYMDEEAVEPHGGFAILKRDLRTVFETLCDPDLICRL